MNKKFNFADASILVFLLLFIVFYALIFVDFSIAPFEDAAILMRYSDNFAQGHGVVWNIGEKPVDGATDFLFMIIVGLFVKAGASLEFSVRFIGFLSHLFTVWIVYLALIKLHNAHFLPSLISSLYLAVGPGLYLVAAYFGTPFFALFVTCTWYCALSIILKGEKRSFSICFAIFSLITSLIRPEGVILTFLMLLAIVFYNGIKKSRRTIYYYLGIFIFLGGIYFLWRWKYFGFPLPNPFYKKGNAIYFSSFKSSIINTIRLSLPFLPVFIIGFYSKKTLRLAISLLIPIIGFASAFILISNEMNFGLRFQYALLPIILMSWWPLIGDFKIDWHLQNWNELNIQKKIVISLLIIVLSLGIIGYQGYVGRFKYNRDGKYDVAIMLSKYKTKKFVIATTEAGLLPLYSHWKALDTWGLNDQNIAHNGLITEDYIKLFKPNIIMFHEFFSPFVSYKGRGSWFDMVMTMKYYAEKNKYYLAAIYGDSPYNTHWYYVRTDFPESLEIVNKIRAIDYYWCGTGRKSVNYGLLITNKLDESLKKDK